MKSKICKPVNSKTRGYDGCGKESNYRKFGLCPSCLFDWMQTDERGKIYYQSQFKPKVKAKVKRTKDQEFKKKKEDITNWRVKLQKKVQEIARLIDNGLPCLARGTFGQIHGGHIFAKGGHSTMALNLHNIHRQSAYSNTYLNDDGLLRERLCEEYGYDYLEFIRSINHNSPLKFSNLEYKEKYETACIISNELKKKDLEYKLKDRIDLRNKINTILEIYEEKYCLYKRTKN